MFIRLKPLKRLCTGIFMNIYSLFATECIAFLCYWSAWLETSIEFVKTNYVIHGICRPCRFLLGSVSNNIELVYKFYFARSDSHWTQYKFPSSFRQERCVVGLFYWSDFEESSRLRPLRNRSFQNGYGWWCNRRFHNGTKWWYSKNHKQFMLSLCQCMWLIGRFCVHNHQ